MNLITGFLGPSFIIIISYRIASYRIASHRIASHRIASHRIVSYILYYIVVVIIINSCLLLRWVFNMVINNGRVVDSKPVHKHVIAMAATYLCFTGLSPYNRK